MMNNAARGGLAIALSLSVLTAANVMGSEPAVITISATNAGPTINLGGWGNTQHGVEMNQTPVGAPVPGQIDRQRWYDVKVEISGSRIRCYLDGQLIHDATVPITQKFYAVTGRTSFRPVR